ncbi:MAG: TolC family protein [Pseudomonadota bacterium]
MGTRFPVLRRRAQSLGAVCILWLGFAPGLATAQGTGDPVQPSEDLGGPVYDHGALLRAAIEGNPRLRDSAVSLDQARARRQGSGAPFDWVLDSGSSITQTLSANPLRPEDLQPRTSIEAYIQLSRRLRTGTELRLRATEAWYEYPLYSYRALPSSLLLTIPGEAIGPGTPDITFPIELRSTETPGPSSIDLFGVNTDISVVQPLLRGRSSDVNDAADRSASVAVLREQTRQRAVASEVLLQVNTLASELALARIDRTLRLAARDLARDELEITRARIEAGQQAPVAELQIQQTVAQREEAALAAERSIYDLDVQLRRALGLPILPGAQPLHPLLLDERDTQAPDTEALLARALARNPGLLAARLSVDEARFALLAAQDRLLPRLDASAGLGLVSQDRNGLAVWQGLFGAREGFNWHAGMLFAMPLENREAGQRVEEARLSMHRASLARDEAEAQVRMDLARALDEARLAHKRIQVSRVSRDLAARNVDVETERYHLGLGTAFELLDAQERLRQAELSLQRAEADLRLARWKRRAITGDLLDDSGVILRD